MNIVAFAGGPVGVSMLDVLAAHDLVPAAVVVSHAVGGARVACPSAVAWCERREVPWAYWQRLAGETEPALWLSHRAPDLLLSLSYDLILPAELLMSAPRAVNVHRGVAPAFRGAYSTIWALELGAAELGVTIHTMVPAVDAGPVLAQRRVPASVELTAAEAIPLIERVAIELLDDVVEDLVADRLPAIAQPEGGKTFGRELPSASLEDVGGSAVVRRVRARYNPPYPSAGIDIGSRRFAMVEQVSEEGLEGGPLRATPLFEPPISRNNTLAFTRGRPVIWTATAEAAAALVLDRVEGPLALPELISPAIRTAVLAGRREVKTYRVGLDLDPDPDALAASALGHVVVLGWPCGRPPSARVRALAAEVGRGVIEDRTQALLNVDPWRGETGLLDLATWSGSLDGAGAVGEGLEPLAWEPVDDLGLATRAAARVAAVERATVGSVTGEPELALRPISRTGAREALGSFDAAEARAKMSAAVGRYLEALFRWCAFTHWPPGTVAHGFPIIVADPERRAAIDSTLPGVIARPFVALADEGPAAARAAALLALPCHAGVTAEHVATVLAGLARAGVDHRGP